MYSTFFYWDCPPSFSRTAHGDKRNRCKNSHPFSSPVVHHRSQVLLPWWSQVPNQESSSVFINQCSVMMQSWANRNTEQEPSRWWWNSHWEINCHLTVFLLPSATCSPCPLLISTHKLPRRMKPSCLPHIPLGTIIIHCQWSFSSFSFLPSHCPLWPDELL